MTIEILPDKVYHGTISVHRESLLNGIDVKRGYKSVDFGQGFYTTTCFEQAEKLACDRAKAFSLKKEVTVKPLVFVYSLDKAVLSRLKGYLFNEANDKWKEFVFNNRVGEEFAISRFHNLKPRYDFVYGKVADSNIVELTRLIETGRSNYGQYADELKPLNNGIYDQLSFHTDNAVLALKLIDDKEG
ncbi:MAG: DUF3990 domain-containing protein [Lachnospiraceae bacterium]|nr:DUF3990 domain-containing protein [Ruminococcus sp.]MCM1277302.1 DUF3990 domain-containing protein [Lachnospiraceae bacterium]